MKTLRHGVLMAALAMLSAWPAAAAELRWSNRPFQVSANEKRLPDFLRELAASQGTTAVIDPKIDGVISGKFVISGRANEAARIVLDSVCAGYGLTWYYDGSLLFVELASDARSEVLPISAASSSRIHDAVQRLRIADPRFPLVINANEGHVFVAGPKRYVESVRQLVRSIDYRAAQADRSEVRLFPLKYAWASDFEIRRPSKNTVVPGVVNVLRSLFDPRANMARVGATGGTPSAVAMPRVTGNRAFRLPSGESGTAPKIEPGVAGTEDDTVLSPAASRGELPQIQADTRMNAVLIRDVPERMAEYERLIAAMDTKPRLVEIEVTIMDISTDSLDQLGVDWRMHGHRVDLQTGNGGAPGLTWDNTATAPGQALANAPEGGLLRLAIGDELRSFLLARVSALAQRGQANFVARPKVLTLDNTEASLENKSEFYIKVPGFQDSSLYTVMAGTDVRVTPLVIDETSGRGVLMTINIGDDSVTADMVDNLPVVRRRSVITQAMVDEGKSILLAGYSSEERINGKSGVPVLSSIPVIGKLFEYTEKRRANLERFYMLTPRFVVPEAAVPVPGAAPAPVPQGEDAL